MKNVMSGKVLKRNFEETNHINRLVTYDDKGNCQTIHSLEQIDDNKYYLVQPHVLADWEIEEVKVVG
ncbi:hypothetical protein [Bacillus phage YungSlug]|nr:hypothetical protein [Bacillus phage YungSlug]